MNNIRLCVSAMTTAARAKHILSEYGIAADIRKSDCGMGQVGCSYEVTVPNERLSVAADILIKNGIKLIKQI